MESSSESSDFAESSSESPAESLAESSSKSNAEYSSSQTPTETKNNSNSTSVILYILFIPMCVVIVFATLWINRFIRIKKRKSRFSNKDKNKALLEIYSYIVKLLLYKINIDEDISTYDNIKKLIEKEEISPEKKKWYEIFCNDVYPIAERAKFSGKAITSEELSLVLRYSQEIYNSTINSLNYFQRFIAKYLDVL